MDEDTLARRRRVLGEDQPDTLTAAANLADQLISLGDYEGARCCWWIRRPAGGGC
ncbi:MULTISPECIES: tetratricopeptide repeat protein [Frankia]|uniref:tetratricopeptide repeat protein n=1 Tax=Frankia TaxID=1854 RepID=UPI000AF1F219|nr:MULTISPECIES: tetratricopeptide repeat protein [Frankia]